MYISSYNNVLFWIDSNLLPTDYPASEASHNRLSFFIRFLGAINASTDLTENISLRGRQDLQTVNNGENDWG